MRSSPRLPQARVTCTSASFTMLRELLARLVGGAAPSSAAGCATCAWRRGASSPTRWTELERRLGVPVVTGLASSEAGTIAQQGLPPAPRERGVGRAAGRVRGPAGRRRRAASSRRARSARSQVRGAAGVRRLPRRPGAQCRELRRRLVPDGRSRALRRRRRAPPRRPRQGAVINRGGDKISPLEIDAVLRAMPGVADAAAFARAASAAGRGGGRGGRAASPGSTVDGGVRRCSARADVLGANRAPRRLWFVDTLPRTDGGQAPARRSAGVGRPRRRHRRTAPRPRRADGRQRVADRDRAGRAVGERAAACRRCRREPISSCSAAIRCAARSCSTQVRAVFGVELPLDALFDDAGTIAGDGAAHRRAAGRSAARRARPSDDPAPRPQAPRCRCRAPQLRAWFLHRLDPGSAAYNEARMWHIDGALDVGALRAALAAVAARQPMLRTRFVGVDGEPRQVIDAEAERRSRRRRAARRARRRRAAARRARCASARRVPFDLAAAPPMRWTLFELGPRRYALLRVWHHILGDGLSAGLLQDELSTAYAAARAGRTAALPPLAGRLRRLRRLAGSSATAGAAARRARSPTGRRASPTCRCSRFPTDFRRPPAQSFRGGVVTRLAGGDARRPR